MSFQTRDIALKKKNSRGIELNYMYRWYVQINMKQVKADTSFN